MGKDKVITHPSFGLASFSRVNGYSGFMFGSDVQSESYIELTISPAERVQGDFRLYYHSNRSSIVKVKMTQTQFAELLTNMNRGEGVPVTIESIGGQRIEQCNVEDVKAHLDELKDDFKQRTKKTLNSLVQTSDELKTIINKKNLSKKDQEIAKELLDKYIREIRSNIPFFLELYKEETDNIVQRAKAEIDGVIQSSIVNAGIKALGLNSTKRELGNV